MKKTRIRNTGIQQWVESACYLCRIREVEPELGNLVNLTILSIRENNISFLPSTSLPHFYPPVFFIFTLRFLRFLWGFGLTDFLHSANDGLDPSLYGTVRWKKFQLDRIQHCTVRWKMFQRLSMYSTYSQCNPYFFLRDHDPWIRKSEIRSGSYQDICEQ
jgi:hypothetical protein